MTHFTCFPLPGPPADAVLQAQVSHLDDPKATEREKFPFFNANARADSVACHASFVPYGLAVENYDGAGRYRRDEFGKVLDTSGQLSGPDGLPFIFRAEREFFDTRWLWRKP